MLRAGMISDDLAFWRAVCGSISSQVDSGVCRCHCHCLSLCHGRCHCHVVTLSFSCVAASSSCRAYHHRRPVSLGLELLASASDSLLRRTQPAFFEEHGRLMDAIAAAEDAQRAAGVAPSPPEPVAAAVLPRHVAGPEGQPANDDGLLGAAFFGTDDDELEAALMLPDPHMAAKRAARETAGDGQGPGKRRRTEEAGGPSAADTTHAPKELVAGVVDEPPSAMVAVGAERPSAVLASAQAPLHSSPAATEDPGAQLDAAVGKRKAASSSAAEQSDSKRPRSQPMLRELQQVTKSQAPAVDASHAAADGGGSDRDKTPLDGGNATGEELRREAERQAARDRVSASPDTPPDGQRRKPSQETSAMPARPAAPVAQSGDMAPQTAAPEPSGLASTGAAPALVPCFGVGCSCDPARIRVQTRLQQRVCQGQTGREPCNSL